LKSEAFLFVLRLNQFCMLGGRRRKQMQVQIPGKRKIMGTPITSLNFFTPQQYSFSDFDSSNIQAFFYVPMTQMLTVLFVRGAVYEYFGVPWHIVQAWNGAGSKGQYHYYLIRMKYYYKRVA
jgi:hypothetical protein